MKITKAHIRREGHYPSEDPFDYTAEIEYSTYAKSFYIRIPEKIKGFKCHDEIDQDRLVGRVKLRSAGFYGYIGDTEKEVIAKAREHLSLFAAESPDTRKVILYQFRYGVKDVRRSGGSAASHLASENAASLTIDYIVCYETIHGRGKTYERRIEKGGKIERQCISNLTFKGYGLDRDPDYFVMEWTEEREEYFDNLVSQMETLIGRINEYVTDETAFTALVDSGGQNLLTEGE